MSSRLPIGVATTYSVPDFVCSAIILFDFRATLFLDSCIHYATFAAYDFLHPATGHPEASHANYYASRFSVREVEGSAPLDHRAMRNDLDDRADSSRLRLSAKITSQTLTIEGVFKCLFTNISARSANTNSKRYRSSLTAQSGNAPNAAAPSRRFSTRRQSSSRAPAGM